MHHFFAFCAIMSLGYLFLTHIHLASHVASHVTDESTITYTCPDTSQKTIPYKVSEDMVAYIKPSPIYPFDPEHITQHNPRLLYASLMCAGMCALWAYVAYLAALKEGN